MFDEGLQFLVNEAGEHIYDYVGLKHNGKYKRGPWAAVISMPFLPSGSAVVRLQLGWCASRPFERDSSYDFSGRLD